MRARTAVAVVAVAVVLAGVAGFALLSDSTVALEERWVSETARDTRVNHHAVGAGDGLVVAPVAVPARPDLAVGDCALVSLDDDGAVEWRASIPPANCSVHSITQPAVGDVDGDGEPEVLVATTERALVVYGPDGNEEDRIPLGSYGYSQPTLGDERRGGDGDSGGDGSGSEGTSRDVVVSDIAGQVTLVRDGEVVWRTDLNETTLVSPRLTDEDGDGEREVLVGTNRAVVSLGADGRVEWRVDAGADTMALADADGDGDVEALLGDTRTLVLVDEGETVWTRTLTANPTVRATSDGDGDGEPEAYVGFTNGSVAAVDVATGRTEWVTSVSTERRRLPPPVLADVDGEGAAEVVAVTNQGRVAVLDPASGRLRGDYAREVPIWTFATPTDLDGDGDDELLVRYGDGRVVALDWPARG